MTRLFQSIFAVTLIVFCVAAADGPTLTQAAKSGDKEALRALLKQGAKAGTTDGDGTTALHWASYRDDLESAELLIRAGAPVNAANDLGATALWAASQNGSGSMVRTLLAAGANPNLALIAGETPLMVASRAGAVDVVEQLVAAGANLEARAARGQTALMWAVAQQHADVVRMLVARGANVKARSDTYSEVMAVSPHGMLEFNKSIPHGNDTALLFAARVGDLASAKLLVTGGADVNDADAWGVTGTTVAAHAGFTDLVEFLLDKGADPNLATPGFTALHEAIMRRDERLATLLLAHGANPNAPLTTWTPTRRASQDFNFQPPLVGARPFWLAARVNAPAIMRLLLKHGADPLFVHHADYYGGESLVHEQNQLTAVMAAVGMGGRINPWVPFNRNEREALTLESLRVAMEAGVDVNAADLDGRTALDAANAAKLQSVVKYLTEKGARSGKQ